AVAAAAMTLVPAIARAAGEGAPKVDAKPNDDAKTKDDAKPPPAEDPLQVVVTGTRTAEDIQRSVLRVDLVTRKEARRRGATNVGEAVGAELGVEVNQSAYGSLGRPSAAQIGGLDRERVLIMQDGERVVGDVGGAVDLSQ